ncbi:hypothetical protein PR002_g7918 [Phytophthora rubi]|uniref:Uncharacterized protein n=1 Tax=Phytophthora rubi TaxID=129364 RepID=A0A6A3MPE4_9STRA|nr:hypothetical protein PR002_g7918 [Phytophthora rubi]
MLTSPRSRKGSEEGESALGAAESTVQVTEVSVVKRKPFISSLAQSSREDEQRQVEELAQVSVTVHHSTAEQMRLLYAQQRSTAKQTEEYLQQQYDNRLALYAKNEAISKRLEGQQKSLFKPFEMLSGAIEAVGRHGRQIEALQESAGGSGGDDEDMADPGRTTTAARTARLADTVANATGASMPTAPVYWGCTRKEKKAFMDSYLVYERRVRALNAGSICIGLVTVT